MGSVQSYLSPETALTAVFVAGALGIGYHQFTAPSIDAAGSTTTTSSKKTKKRKKALEGAEILSPSSSSKLQSPFADLPTAAIPGQFDDASSPPSPLPKAKKSKKKKTKASVEAEPLPVAKDSPSSSSTQPSRQQQPSSTSIDTDGSWTRVESRRRAEHGDERGLTDLTTSDAGITTSLTGNSSSVDDESPDDRRTLVERLAPQPPKTSVDDLLEPSDSPTVARVMRIQPLPNEKPAPGFSWGDYEDVHDADGEDDGWGVVKSKRSRPKRDVPIAEEAVSEAPTKKQRQNAQRREAQKAQKAAAETERLATLAKHKRELEHVRMLEQSSNKGKTSGGMTPVVDKNGKLVWE